ncbi:hypothetical protein PVIIG_04463 [Plasmodium vivax India VII]|uniref:Uncharacterized protein n=4 Tax=Plasmodium vivax TaxID=5855 RepID=A5K5C5_PLAVS|nr:hypothetical protein PVX_092940 [Plasmodium vivax]EDL45853.1 hypothetical protein PVX_092940 [Plasmodium vivax]KMZ82349.1 hypothetical protein PVIIG_04463 [Plasmodium vivax India VII]KMZ86452.1 hypothetical protein PVBG_05320 [Plasmodium vivax Brazil I]KMZ92872.1 hypothetical protein PVMG_05432 [Plasmodium vivax Mauritania I]|eukprot:XP_001615580.1 hypothetical protein [Plasmodium vivax Sal-1]
MVATVSHFTNYEFTMDEPVKDTVIRDAKSIYKKILHICFHQYDDDNTVKKCNAYLEEQLERSTFVHFFLCPFVSLLSIFVCNFITLF